MSFLLATRSTLAGNFIPRTVCRWWLGASIIWSAVLLSTKVVVVIEIGPLFMIVPTLAVRLEGAVVLRAAVCAGERGGRRTPR